MECFLQININLAIPLYNISASHRIHNDIHAELGIVFCQETLVPEIIIPFAAVILIAVQYSYTSIYFYSFQVIMYQVIAPTVQLEGRIGWTLLERKEGTVYRVPVGYFFKRICTKERCHLCLK